MNLLPKGTPGARYGTSLAAGTALLAALAAGSGVQAQTPGKLIAFWDFNDASSAITTADALHSFSGVLEKGAVFTADQGGRSGLAGDRAMDFGPTSDSQLVRVSSAGWLNTASAADQMTVTYWQKLRAVAASSAFWMVSPSSSGTARGSQAHSTWSDRNVYWDTSGCCDGTLQRLSTGIDTLGDDFPLTEWHHFAFVKNADVKQIYVDGQLLIEGSGSSPLPTDFTQFVMGADQNGGNSMQGWLDDFAVFGAPLTLEQVQALAGGASPKSFDSDTDGDGMPDWWEEANTFNKNDPADAILDADTDASNNLAEYRRATNPRNADTDGDGLKDGIETGTGTWVSATDTGTSPFLGDTDGDGLLDSVETNTGSLVDAANTGSSPLKPDSDGDQFPDGTEVLLGSNPNQAASTPLKANDVNLLAYWPFNDASVADQTKDKVHNFAGTLTNGAAFTADQGGRTGAAGDRAMDFTLEGTGQRVETPGLFAAAVAPGDAITLSYWQLVGELTDSVSAWLNSPSSAGTRGAAMHNPWSNRNIYWDTAGCCDGATQRINKGVADDFDFAIWHHYAFVKIGALKQIWIDGVLFLEGNNTSRLPADFDRLFIGGAPGYNSVRGLIDDFAIFAKGLSGPEVAALALGIAPDQIGADADSDGMNNVWELANGFNPQDAADAVLDADSDGLTNLREFQRNTNPRNADSDGDTVADGAETGTGVWVSNADRGTDPLNVDSDGDGVRDAAENNTGTFVDATNTGSNPNDTDSDDDTFLDGVELSLGSNPVSAASVPVTAGQLNLLAFWNFNNVTVLDRTLDQIHGFVGAVESSAGFTADQGGRSGAVGDHGMDFGVETVSGENRAVRVNPAPWLNAGSALDQLTVSVWQKLYDAADSSTFWLVSPGSSQRGFQSHIPWSNGRIYFDTTGCCAGNQRIDKAITDFNPDFDLTVWHNYVFVKNGGTKEIWIDGQLFHSGTGALPLPLDFTQVIIGNNSDVGANIHGVVDDFLIYAAALTPQEIGLLAQGTLPPARVVPAVELQSSVTLNGSFATDAGATWNETTKTFTTTSTDGTRFFRISAASALTIQSISVNGNAVTIVYQ